LIDKEGVVQVRVTPKTKNPFTIKAISISDVTWKRHVLNHAVPHVTAPRRGDAVVFAVNQRPVQGSRGFYRTVLRHGVGRIRAGRRHTVGIIFHDAA
jgi:hypothetical protein